MKRILNLLISLFAFFVAVSLTITTVQAAPTFRIDPTKPIVEKNATFTAEGCKSGQQVGFDWSQTTTPDKHTWRNADATGKATFTTSDFEIGTYNVWVDCDSTGGPESPVKFTNAFTVLSGVKFTVHTEPGRTDPDLGGMTNLVVQGCPPPPEKVHIACAAVGAFRGCATVDLTPNAQGTAIREFEQGRYQVDITCGGETINDWRFTAASSNKIIPEFVEPNIVTIEGCPPNGQIDLVWAIVGIAAGDSTKITADADGKANHVFGKGSYILDISCGGEEYQDFKFDVAGKKTATPTPWPTLPEPPPPVCRTMVDGKCTVVNTALGEINTDGPQIIYSLFILILSLSGGIMILTIMYAAYLILSSRGNPEQLQKGREALTSAIVGFLFILFSYVIFGIITVDVLHLPGFSR